MALLDIFKRNKEPKYNNYVGSNFAPLLYSGSSFNSDRSMNLSTVYRCVNVISDSISQLQIDIFRVDSNGYKVKDYNHNLFRVLNKPNERMSRFTWMSLIIQSMLLYGNAYALILRDSNRQPKQLIFIPHQYVTIVEQTKNSLIDPVKYQISGYENLIDSKDMLHFINYTYNGVYGISTIEFAKNSLGLAHDSEQHARNFFQKGCGIGGILKSSTMLGPEQKKKIKADWEQSHTSINGNTNAMVVLEANLDFVPMTVSAKDAQLLESRLFNITTICQFFGVSPVKCFDYSKSSYNTLEQANLSFLTDTVSPLIQKLELEMERKLCGEEKIDIKFNVSELLRTDKSSQAEYFSKMFQNGSMTINEIRKELDLPKLENGDNNFVQVNLQTLTNAVTSNPKDSQDIKEELNVFKE